MNNLKFWSAMTLLAIAASSTSCKEATVQQSEKSYKTLTIENSNTNVNSKYTASIRGEQFVDIRPQISGVITNIAIAEGAKVTKGQTLFVIDQVPYQAALEVAKANVKSAKATVATAQLNVDSNKELLSEKVISQIEYQTSLNTLASAQAALALAEANQKIASNNLSYTVIKSPVNGVAGMINYRIGALVSSSSESPLVSVSNNDHMYAYFSISESSLISLLEQSGSTEELLAQMDSVTLILNNGSTYSLPGKVDAISGVIEQSTGTVGLRALFDNPDQILRDGGNGSLVISTLHEDVIVIPKVATYEIQNKIFAFKVIDGKASSAEITVMPNDNGQEYIVTRGLSQGDVIIAEGAGLLREGTVINAK